MYEFANSHPESHIAQPAMCSACADRKANTQQQEPFSALARSCVR